MLYGIMDLERQELQKIFSFFLENAYKSENNVNLNKIIKDRKWH